MSSTIGVAYYPEGAGHATRMLAIAEALDTSGVTVELAGGGAGARFVELNGYEQFEPTPVNFIDTYQHGSQLGTLTESVPNAVRRTADYRQWFRDNRFDAVVTDDMFAAIAAATVGVPLYVVKHDMPGLYPDAIQQAGAAFHVRFQQVVSHRFFYPSVCPPSAVDAEDVTRVPPLALTDDGRTADTGDVVVVPSHYSNSTTAACDRLESAGYDVVHVGGEDWDPVPAMLPYLRGVDAVVCAGYSTVMEAAVAGTPCIIWPETDEQEGVAQWVEQTGAEGFTVVRDVDELLAAVESLPPAPSFENGAAVVADQVRTDLAEMVGVSGVGAGYARNPTELPDVTPDSGSR